MALAVASQLQAFSAPANLVIYPTLVELAHTNDWDMFVRLIKKSTKYVLVLLTACAYGVLFALPPVILLWKKEFYEALPAVQVMLAAFIFEGAAFWLRPAAMALGKPVISTETNFIRVVVLVAGSCLLVPRCGSYGFVAQAWVLLAYVVISLGWAIMRLRGAVRRAAAAGV